MKTNENNDSTPGSIAERDRQSRREFFNGLGKWSMIVIAAVSSLRGSISQDYSSPEETSRPEWARPETPAQRLARKHRQHVDQEPGHINFPHGDVAHVDTKIQQRGGSGGAPSPSGRPSKISR